MHWAQATCAVVRVAVARRVVVALGGPHVGGIVVEATAAYYAVGAVADPSPPVILLRPEPSHKLFSPLQGVRGRGVVEASGHARLRPLLLQHAVATPAFGGCDAMAQADQ